MYEDRTPEGQDYKTRHPPDEDKGLRGIQDFAGLGTLWDLGLCRKQVLYTPRTRILFCGVL